MKLKFVASAILFAISAAFATAAPIVTNGSFEAPYYGGGWGLSSTDGQVGGWFAEADQLEIGAGNIYGVSGYDQLQVLELDGNANAKVSQNLTTSATTYAVTFTAALRSGVSAADQGGDLYWNDTFVGSFLPSSSAMQAYSFNVTGTGADKLSFVGTGASNSLGTLIDNVSVQAVPEPTSIAALAVGALALLRRRKNA